MNLLNNKKSYIVKDSNIYTSLNKRYLHSNSNVFKITINSNSIITRVDNNILQVLLSDA